jgi:hypothetical protein
LANEVLRQCRILSKFDKSVKLLVMKSLREKAIYPIPAYRTLCNSIKNVSMDCDNGKDLLGIIKLKKAHMMWNFATVIFIFTTVMLIAD